jgi:hypothetical protein
MAGAGRWIIWEVGWSFACLERMNEWMNEGWDVLVGQDLDWKCGKYYIDINHGSAVRNEKGKIFILVLHP